MDDKNLMESLLLTTKGVGDLYLHGSIESSTAKVRGVFDSSLTRTLQMQKEIYDKMKEKQMQGLKYQWKVGKKYLINFINVMNLMQQKGME